MLCDECGKNPANVRFVTIVSGQKNERNLCSECASKLNLNKRAVDVGQLLSAIVSGGIKPDVQQANLSCAACGAKFGQTLRMRRVGCPSCYESFRAQLASLLKKQHGSDAHIGRKPHDQDEAKEDPLDQLRQEMEMAVACENFEQAASLRDAIRALTAAREGGTEHA